MIYHITTHQAWQEAQAIGTYTAPSLAIEGFIHASTALQVPKVANAFYRDIPDLVLLHLDDTRLEASLKWEAPVHPNNAPTNGTPINGTPTDETVTEQFPHIYGSISLDEVVKVTDLLPDTEGNFHFTA